MFEKLDLLVKKLNETNSTNDKKEVLRLYSDFHTNKILNYTYDPFKQYGVTSKNLKKNFSLVSDWYQTSLFDLLDDLNDRKITGHQAISFCNAFVKSLNKEHHELFYNIIDKDLKCRIGIDVINTVFPNLIPKFEVCLAKNYDDFKEKVNFEKKEWFCSAKKDGIRIITVKTGSSVKFFSRNGKEIFTLDRLIPDVLSIPLDNFVLDGELCIVDEKGNENFTSIVSEFRKKNHIIENPRYLVFDFLTTDEFFSQKSDRKLSERLGYLHNFQESFQNNLRILDNVLASESYFNEMIEYGINNNWEGLMLRKNVGYEGKRTKNLLKVKQFKDDEFVVKDVEYNDIRYIIEENGKTKEISEEMLSAVGIDYKGFPVSVGSGFSIEQRKEYYKNPEKIIGKTITVKYFGESSNDKGGLSLRFPTLKMIHGEEREF